MLEAFMLFFEGLQSGMTKNVHNLVPRLPYSKYSYCKETWV